VLLATATWLSACDDFSYYDLIDEATDGEDADLELQISPITASVPAGAYLIFTARGGTKPYAYTMVSGAGTIDPEHGVYSAPESASVDIVRVTDSDGTYVDAQIVVVE
jgi:hypothetical protein